jgi:hypothetical protein
VLRESAPAILGFWIGFAVIGLSWVGPDPAEVPDPPQ